MSLQPGALMASVSPRVRLVPVAADSEGLLACELADRYGMTPFDWQADALVDLMGVRVDGRWAASRAGIVVPRQNGKNGAAEIYELWVTSQLGMRVLHSAHEVKTARKAFKRLLDFYDNPRRFPELHALVKEIRRTNGQEAIELHNGGSVEFLARTRSSGRGYSADVLLLDEAQELTEDELEAMQPTVSASQNSQIILTGTAPKASKPATVWRRFRQAGMDGTDRRLFWLDYSADVEDDFASRDVWAKANPGAPVSIPWEAIEDEFAAMSPEGFAAERLGVWFDAHAVAGAFDAGVWQALVAPAPPWGRDTVFALDVAPDHSSATIAAAWSTDTGSWVQLADHRPGVEWVPDRAAELLEGYGGRLLVEQTGTAGFLLPRLTAEGVSRRFFVDACSTLDAAVGSRTIRHGNQPDLNAAVDVARWSTSGDAGQRVLSRKNSQVSPLVAVAMALHGLTTSMADSGGWMVSVR